MSVLHPTGVLRKLRLWLSRFRLTEVTRFLSILFAILGIASGVGSYLILTNVTPLETKPETVWTLLSFNIFIIGGLLLFWALKLCACVAANVPVWPVRVCTVE